MRVRQPCSARRVLCAQLRHRMRAGCDGAGNCRISTTEAFAARTSRSHLRSLHARRPAITESDGSTQTHRCDRVGPALLYSCVEQRAAGSDDAGARAADLQREFCCTGTRSPRYGGASVSRAIRVLATHETLRSSFVLRHHARKLANASR